MAVLPTLLYFFFINGASSELTMGVSFESDLASAHLPNKPLKDVEAIDNFY
jgi:hypothetical protein